MELLHGTYQVLSYQIESDVAGIESRPCYRGVLKLRDVMTNEEHYDLGPAWNTEQSARRFGMTMMQNYGRLRV